MSAFSNSTEWEIWSSGWCDRCIKDELGGAPEGTHCPIITNLLAFNEAPPEFIEIGMDYICTEFMESPW